MTQDSPHDAFDEATCDACKRPRAACVCDRVSTYATTRRVLILQHPQEIDAVLGSAQIVTASLPRAQLVVGLSWRSFAHALDEEDADVKKWAVLFPDRESECGDVIARNREILEPNALAGIVVIDGTWSKAKTLWWRNPWLAKMNRLTLKPKHPSAYGRLRAEPRRDFVSTLESVGLALTLCGEDPQIEAGLLRAFRTLVQRVRDAKLVPSAERTRKKRRPRGATPARGRGPT